MSANRSSLGPAISEIRASPADRCSGVSGHLGEGLRDGSRRHELRAHQRHAADLAVPPPSTSCATNSWNCDARRMRAGMAPDR